MGVRDTSTIFHLPKDRLSGFVGGLTGDSNCLASNYFQVIHKGTNIHIIFVFIYMLSHNWHVSRTDESSMVFGPTQHRLLRNYYIIFILSKMWNLSTPALLSLTKCVGMSNSHPPNLKQKKSIPTAGERRATHHNCYSYLCCCQSKRSQLDLPQSHSLSRNTGYCWCFCFLHFCSIV